MKQLNLTPIGDRVYVLPDPKVEQTEGGLIIPEMSQTTNLQGTIVAKGEGMYAVHTGVLIPMQTKLGDKVVYSPHIGNSTTIDGVEYLIMKETDIYAIV